MIYQTRNVARILQVSLRADQAVEDWLFVERAVLPSAYQWRSPRRFDLHAVRASVPEFHDFARKLAEIHLT